MSNNELELIELIRENDDPEHALLVAADIIVEYLRNGKVVAGHP
jgi:hypothetical protein